MGRALKIVVRRKQPRRGPAYLRAFHPEATKVEADDQAAKSGVAGVASAAMRRPINVKSRRLALAVTVDL